MPQHVVVTMVLTVYKDVQSIMNKGPAHYTVTMGNFNTFVMTSHQKNHVRESRHRFTR